MGAAVIPLVIASSVLGAVGSIQEGQAANQQANFQANIAKNNADLASRKADEAREFGKVSERKNQIAVLQLLGQQRAAAAANGVDVNVGSAADLQADTVAFGRLDDLTIRNNAEREALGFEAQGTNFLLEEQAFKASGQAAVTAGFIGAASSLTKSGTVASKWLPASGGTT